MDWLGSQFGSSDDSVTSPSSQVANDLSYPPVAVGTNVRRDLRTCYRITAANWPLVGSDQQNHGSVIRGLASVEPKRMRSVKTVCASRGPSASATADRMRA